MSSNRSSEGLFVAWGMLIIVICLVGSLSTGMGPMEFFVIGATAVIGTLILMALMLGITVTIVNLMRISAKQDDRPLTQRLKEDYNWKAVKDDYKLIIDHVKIYANDEWQAGPGPAIEEKISLISHAARDFWDTQVMPRIRK